MSRATPVRGRGGRLRELAVNGCLTGVTVVRHLREDPLLLLVQTSRRLPEPLTRAVTRVLLAGAPDSGPPSPSVRHAVGLWLAGAPDDAATCARAAARAPGSAPWPTGVRGRLLAELAVQLAEPDLLAEALQHAGPAVRARAAWSRGDVGEALAEAARAPSGSEWARLASEVQLLQPGVALTLSTRRAGGGAVAGPPAGAPAGGTPAAFHLLTNSLPHTQSGYALRSHSVLVAQRAAGVRVAAATRLGYPVVVGRLAARHHDEVDGIAYHRLVAPVPPRHASERLRLGAEQLLPVLDRWQPDVLHTTTHFVNGLVARALAERLGIPWVYEVRGLLEETWVAGRPAGAEREHAAGSERHALLRARETELARSADHVVTLSRTLRTELVERGVPAERITVVPNAVDEALLRLDRTAPDSRRAVGLPPEGFWVGTVSSLVDYEGLDTVIDAVSELRARGLDARLLVVGDGVSRPALERRAAERGLGDAAVFTGRVPRDRAPSYHQALDVFVVPRRDVRVCRRVTPLKPTEAMAVGRPVVASDLPALAELVRPHGSGRLVPPDDAAALADTLHELHDSPALRTELAAAGRAFAATRTWPSAGDAYRALYAELTGAVTA